MWQCWGWRSSVEKASTCIKLFCFVQALYYDFHHKQPWQAPYTGKSAKHSQSAWHMGSKKRKHCVKFEPRQTWQLLSFCSKNSPVWQLTPLPTTAPLPFPTLMTQEHLTEMGYLCFKGQMFNAQTLWDRVQAETEQNENMSTGRTIESSKDYLNNLLKVCAYRQIIDYHMVRRTK